MPGCAEEPAKTPDLTGSSRFHFTVRRTLPQRLIMQKGGAATMETERKVLRALEQYAERSEEICCEEPCVTPLGHPLITIMHDTAQEILGHPVFENFTCFPPK
jgi:hypothetical protein